MANKRELKKFIRNSCGAVAVDMVLARETFPQIKNSDVHEVVRDAVALQECSLRLAAVCNNRQSCNRLLSDFDKGLQEIVKKMNAALPEEVRKQIKEAISR